MQIEFLEPLQKLFLASTLGGLIGLERQIQGQKAGFRTQLIVCLGSALFTICSLKFYENFENLSDPSRMAAQIVVGTGFLGAGVIIKYRNYIRGLTTAATLWVVSAVGVAVGMGEYLIAIVTTLIVLINLMVLKKLEFLLPADRYSNIIITCSYNKEIRNFLDNLLKKINLNVEEYRENYLIEENKIEVLFTVKYKNRSHLMALIDELKKEKDISKLFVD